MTEPRITCPNCNHSIKLTESLAAPLIAETRRQFQVRIESKDAEIAKKIGDMAKQKEDLAKDRAALEDQIVQRLNTERAQIVAAEGKKARMALASEIEIKSKETEELRQLLTANNEKLAAAQQEQAEFLRKQRDLEEKTRELDLTIEKRVQAIAGEIRVGAKNEADDAFKLKLAEKDQQMTQMSRTIEELKRKMEQGSQQTQGEALELELENMLRSRFPMDLIEPVAKGELGADLVHRVEANLGRTAGTILWESKRTKSWSDTWLVKLREDQRRSNADIALIVSQALPKHIETFDLMEGVWITHPRCALPVAIALRQSLIELANARVAQEGQQTKMEQVYHYLTGVKFKQRVEAIIERFDEMRDDLDKERKYMLRQWAKREGQILGVIESTVGMVGDLQSIAGKAMPQIESLDTPLLLDRESTQ